MRTNLAEIRTLSKEREDENLRFRTFLKLHDAPAEELDAAVHRIHESVSSEIDCTTCANCCRYSTPVFYRNDILRMAESLEITPKRFEVLYLRVDSEEDGYLTREAPCPFLKGSRCSHYDSRPDVCESYPHLQRPDFVLRLLSVIHNYGICPIVFNTLELLKDQLWSDRDADPSRYHSAEDSGSRTWLRKRRRADR